MSTNIKIHERLEKIQEKAFCSGMRVAAYQIALNIMKTHGSYEAAKQYLVDAGIDTPENVDSMIKKSLENIG